MKLSKTSAVHTLDWLFNLGSEHASLFKLTREPDIGSNIYDLSFGEPDEDSADPGLPHFHALINIQELESGEVICKIVATHIANDPRESSLASQLRWEQFKRKLPLPKENLPDDEQNSPNETDDE